MYWSSPAVIFTLGSHSWVIQLIFVVNQFRLTTSEKFGRYLSPVLLLLLKRKLSTRMLSGIVPSRSATIRNLRLISRNPDTHSPSTFSCRKSMTSYRLHINESMIYRVVSRLLDCFHSLRVNPDDAT